MHFYAQKMLLAVASVFLSAFLMLGLSALQRSMTSVPTAQLVAGDTQVNRQYPTTAAMMQDSITGENPIMHDVVTFSFWALTALCAPLMFWLLVNLMHRLG